MNNDDIWENDNFIWKSRNYMQNVFIKWAHMIVIQTIKIVRQVDEAFFFSFRVYHKLQF